MEVQFKAISPCQCDGTARAGFFDLLGDKPGMCAAIHYPGGPPHSTPAPGGRSLDYGAAPRRDGRAKVATITF